MQCENENKSNAMCFEKKLFYLNNKFLSMSGYNIHKCNTKNKFLC